MNAALPIKPLRYQDREAKLSTNFAGVFQLVKATASPPIDLRLLGAVHLFQGRQHDFSASAHELPRYG